MKHSRYFLVLVGTLVLYTSCEKEPELTEQQKAAYALSSNLWGGEGKVTVNVYPEGIEREDYEDIHYLRIAFSADNQNNPRQFTAVYGGIIFPAHTGIWSWADASETSRILIGRWSMRLFGQTYHGDFPTVSALTEFSLIPANNPASISFKFKRYAPDSLNISGEYTITLEKGNSKNTFD
jgi:hypothetical protein